MKKIGLSGTALKYLAIIAMTVDHIAVIFFSAGTVPYYLMRLFGRITAPIMVFLLVEGFRHTRSRKKYFRRLIFFAAVSQPIYFLFLYGRMPGNALEYLLHWNVLFTLAVALLVLMIFNSVKIQNASSLITLGILISLSHFGDWSYLIPAWAIIFLCFRNRFWMMAILYAVTSAVLGTLIFLKQFESFAVFSFQFGTLLALIPISLYNSERGTVRHKELNRWFFYVYYPAHMLVLVVLRAILC